MASARKKQEDNNVKNLRELGALPQNKFCFDCGQRGPTYVNVTIGSFVCTKCSGMLRGLTPPHRVKSISMSTFTPEEIDTLRQEGNDFCRKTWLGLYEGTLPSHSDEQGVRDFMVEKYEKKRYYLDSKPESNRTHLNGSTKIQIHGFSRTDINRSNGSTQQNGTSRQAATCRNRPEVKNNINNNLCSNFTVDFDKAEIFSNTSTSSSKDSSANGSMRSDFANFDSNPVSDRSSRSIQGSSHALWASQPVNGKMSKVNGVSSKINGVQLTSASTMEGINVLTQFNTVQDKYAALKDLDEEMKSQSQSPTDIWASSNGGSAGSLYSSPTPTTGSAYGSPSSQGSLFGSPSQAQFMTAFNQENNSMGNSNPFNATAWSTSNTNNVNGYAISNGNHVLNDTNNHQLSQPICNPFKHDQNLNGFANFQAAFPQKDLMVNKESDAWVANPFKVSANAGLVKPSNPFL